MRIYHAFMVSMFVIKAVHCWSLGVIDCLCVTADLKIPPSPTNCLKSKRTGSHAFYLNILI